MGREDSPLRESPEIRDFSKADLVFLNSLVYLVEKMPDRGSPFAGKPLYTASRRKHGA